MKKMFLPLAFMLVLATTNAQSQPASDGSRQATIILANGESVSGTVKGSGLKSGKIMVVNANNKRSTYEAAGIKEAVIDGSRYVSYKNDLFLEVVKGEKVSLYQKQSSSAAKINYNGAEPVLTPASEGNVGDYFLSTDGGTNMQLTSRKKFAEDVKKVCSNCSAVVADIEGGRLGFADIKQVVETLNKL